MVSQVPEVEFQLLHSEMLEIQEEQFQEQSQIILEPVQVTAQELDLEQVQWLHKPPQSLVVETSVILMEDLTKITTLKEMSE